MVAQRVVEGLDQLLTGGSESARGQGGEFLRMGLAVDHPLGQPGPAHTQDVTSACRTGLMFASSSAFWMGCVCRETSLVSCLRVRVRSRSSWIRAGGTKLPRISPCAR